jgi:hypothetical protein
VDTHCTPKHNHVALEALAKLKPLEQQKPACFEPEDPLLAFLDAL